MHRRKLKAFALLLLTALAVAPNQSESQTKKKQTTRRATTRRATKKPAKKPAAPRTPAVSSTAPRSAQQLAADMSAIAGHVRSGQFGIMAVSLTRGDTLFQSNAGTPLMPASTMKMLTSAVAFEQFGPQYQFSTDVLYDGALGSDGTINGNVYLRGDGDPSLSGRYMSGGPGAPMNYLADQLVARGVKRVTGDVIGDASAFDNQKIPEGWLTRYLQAGYAARVSGLSINENLVWVTVTPDGAKLEPATTAIKLVSNVRTVPGSGASISVRRDMNGTITVGGRIGSRSGPRRYVYVIEDPASFTTGALHAAMAAKGIQVDGGDRLGQTPSSAVKIASVQSPTLDRIIAAMNRESINIFAELLMRNAARGKNHEKQGTVANGQALLRNFFATKVHGDTLHLEVHDGSGLSTLDRVTPRLMAQMLGYAHNASWGPSFHASLPVAGESELLRRRMRGGAAQGNLHAKTGTTNDVIGLGGYVTALNGEVIAFSFIYNGADRWTAKSMIDVMGQTLANFAR
jgi:D-alanyl-D-alanine carboxypeptidase/D-alanyl-D-alanine-endopeptidase (penicillin-binding protein 4)